MKSYLLYGKQEIQIEIPDNSEIIMPKNISPLENISEELRKNLLHPIGAKSLAEIIKNKNAHTCCIVVDDITRPVPYKKFLPVLLNELKSNNLKKEDIIILVATGMHRPSTQDEKKEMFGEKITAEYKIIDHIADDKNMLIRLPGRTSAGTEVSVNKYYYNANLKILTGLIEPHFMAGFSGGRKSVCPGIVDLNTISNFHGYKFLSSKYATNGVIENNPCHKEAMEVAEKAGADFIINVVINKERKITKLLCGDLKKAHIEGLEFVKSVSGVKVNSESDIVITSGGGYPLDKTFYQTIKGMVGALPFVKKTGYIIIASQCSEGIGSRGYKDILFNYSDDWERFIYDIKNTKEVKKDQWEFQMQCRVLEKIPKEHLILYSEGISKNEKEKINTTPAENFITNTGGIEKELQSIINNLTLTKKNLKITVIPEGPYVYGF